MAKHTPADLAYAYCEPVTASTRSPQHIRTVGAEGLRLGGGAPDSTLCGYPLDRGWDQDAPVTVADVRRELEMDAPPEINPLCRGCGEEFLRRTGQPTVTGQDQ